MPDFFRKLLRENVSKIKNWRSAEDNYVKLYKTILFYQGFWPAMEQTHGQRFKTFRYWNPRLVVLSWIYNAVVTFPMTLYMVSGESALALLEPFVFTFVSVLMAVIGICLIYRKATFQAMVDAFNETKKCANLLQEPPEHILARGKMRREALLLTVVAFGVLAMICVFCPLPYLVANRKLHIRCWHAYNVTASPYYEATMVGWVVHLCTDVGYSFPVMGLICTLLGEAIHQLEMLNHNLATVKRSATRVTLGNYTPEVASAGGIQQPAASDINKNMGLGLQRCVRHHQAIISFVRSIERCSSPILGTFLAGFLVPASLVIVTLPRMVWSTSLIVQALLLACGVVVLSVAFSFTSSITEQNELVRDSVFSSDWISASESFKQSMRIIMVRGNAPLVPKIAGFVDMSLKNLREVFYITYKFYMFVRDVSLVPEE